MLLRSFHSPRNERRLLWREMLAEYGTNCDLFCFSVYKSQKLPARVYTFISQIRLFGELSEGNQQAKHSRNSVGHGLGSNGVLLFRRTTWEVRCRLECGVIGPWNACENPWVVVVSLNLGWSQTHCGRVPWRPQRGGERRVWREEVDIPIFPSPH